MEKLEIDIYKKNGLYCLDMKGERMLASSVLSEVVDKMEKEIKRNFGIEDKKKMLGMFGR